MFCRRVTSKILGLPLSDNLLSLDFWAPAIEKIGRRLHGCMKAFISIGGRLTLVSLVLASIPHILCLSLKCLGL